MNRIPTHEQCYRKPVQEINFTLLQKKHTIMEYFFHLTLPQILSFAQGWSFTGLVLFGTMAGLFYWNYRRILRRNRK